ncbi:MAG TPA: hypothetical protein VF796_18860 [Humisphaera sp.]
MPVAAEGPIAVHVAAVRELIAASATWRAWVGAASAADAAMSVYPVGLPPPPGRASFSREDLRELRPFAVVNVGGRGEQFAFRRAALGQFVPGGTVLVGFEDEVLVEDGRNFADHTYEFLNRVGAVVAEALEAGEGGGFPVIQAARVSSPYRAKPEEVAARGDYLACGVAFDFGLDR